MKDLLNLIDWAGISRALVIGAIFQTIWFVGFWFLLAMLIFG